MSFLNHGATIKHSLFKLLRFLLLAELAYLVLFNSALNLPLTQSAINMFKPDKFHVRWDRAWTWYPFRAHARGISANGQSRSQQWQVDAVSASGSISLLPLVLKRVKLHSIIATDIDYRQRPRLKDGKDYSGLLPHYPLIEGREIVAVDSTPWKKKRPWRLFIDGLRGGGELNFWVHQIRGNAQGYYEGDMTFVTRGGAFSLTGKEMDLALGPVFYNGQEVFETGQFNGQLGFTPFVPRENKGLAMLSFLTLDVDTRLTTDSLAFISLFTQKFGGLKVDGRGVVSGALRLEDATVLSPTDLAIQANDLFVTVLGHEIRGQGTVDIERVPDTDDQLSIGLHFHDLAAFQANSDVSFVTGNDLHLAMGGGAYLLRDRDQLDEDGYMELRVEALSVPDLAAFQRYLPEQWPLHLHGGKGYLDTTVRVLPTALEVALDIRSEHANLGLKDYRFDTDLDFALRLNNPSLFDEPTSIAGSYLKLIDANLTRGVLDSDAPPLEPWELSLAFTEGSLQVLSDTHKVGQNDVIDLLRVTGRAQAQELLGGIRGSTAFEARVSSLAWISIFLGDELNTTIDGSGQLEGRLELDSGWFTPGTRALVVSDDLQLNFLDYYSQGRGEIRLDVREGGEMADWELDVSVFDAQLRRANESEALVDDVELTMSAHIEDLELDKPRNDLALDLRILSAHISDMALFNTYLPETGPISFTGGTAAVEAEVALTRDTASGWLTLRSRDVALQADDQSLSATLEADVKLSGGHPAAMHFDISGSQLRLNEVEVRGERAQFEARKWATTIDLLEGETRWKSPFSLDVRAEIQMSDTRPVVALFNNRGWRPKWLSKMMLVEDIRGDLELKARDKTYFIPHAHAVGDTVEVGGKGVVEKGGSSGVIYARYKKLDALIRIDDGKKNIDLIKAEEKYQQYRAATPQ